MFFPVALLSFLFPFSHSRTRWLRGTLMAFVYYKGLEGHAEPAIPGDDLDVTKPKNQDDGNTAFSVPDSSAGLSMLSKLFLASLVVTCCVIFVKTRRTASSSWSGKSMA